MSSAFGDSYTLALTPNLPFITCSGDAYPSKTNLAQALSLLQSACNPGGCQEDGDKPQCARVSREDPNYFIQLIAQNYGDGGIPHCEPIAAEIIAKCVLGKGNKGGDWGVGGYQGGSQEYIRLEWVDEQFQDFEDEDLV
jgi:hypothetical protein